MKHIQTLSLSLLFAVASFSCSDNNTLLDQIQIQNETTSDLLKGITAQVPDFEFEDEDATRAAHTFSPSTGFSFVWTEGDTLGIFPVGSNQVDFPVVDGIGTSRAEFSGGAWALRATYDYASYFPFRGDNYFCKMTELPVSYVGQEMDGNDPYANLGKYDFLVSAPAKTSAKGTVNLDLKHLGCYTLFMLTLPEPGSYKYLALSCDDPVFVHEATYDLSAATPALTPKKSYNTYRIDLKNVTATVANQRVDIPIMLAPVNLSGKTITLSMLKNDGKVFTTTVGGKDMSAGKAYGYTPTSAFTEKEEQIIAKMKDGSEFNKLIKQTAGTKLDYTQYMTKDYLVKEVVFDYRSTVSSGKIVSATDSPYPIYANYADGVITISTEAERISMSDIRYMFCFFVNLQRVDLSGIDTKNATSMYEMFWSCESLTSLDLSGIDTQNVKNMYYTFCSCESLTDLDLSSFNTQNVTNMEGMFKYCSSLKNINLSSFNTQNVTNMKGMFQSIYNINSLNLGTQFTIGESTDKTDMCSSLGSKNVTTYWTISCTEATKTALLSGTKLNNSSFLTWNILQ